MFSKVETLGAEWIRLTTETTEQRAGDTTLGHHKRQDQKINANDNDSLVSDADLQKIEDFANGDLLVSA
ncbi:hypothetical protein ACT17_22580 [Mycolicibacterium conceptionense]|uniref:Uncharacterized protein n=1 Tax=Mycolicibacterium conceptionense TaxID=451644 RepID=A0A0J8WSB3_9MYCO|nr:hypothetical protein ACT17_22580 [Mycolicibacterium conceptionense]